MISDCGVDGQVLNCTWRMGDMIKKSLWAGSRKQSCCVPCWWLTCNYQHEARGGARDRWLSPVFWSALVLMTSRSSGKLTNIWEQIFSKQWNGDFVKLTQKFWWWIGVQVSCERKHICSKQSYVDHIAKAEVVTYCRNMSQCHNIASSILLVAFFWISSEFIIGRIT